MHAVESKEPKSATPGMGWRCRYQPWNTNVKYSQPGYNTKADAEQGATFESKCVLGWVSRVLRYML